MDASICPQCGSTFSIPELESSRFSKHGSDTNVTQDPGQVIPNKSDATVKNYSDHTSRQGSPSQKTAKKGEQRKQLSLLDALDLGGAAA